MHSKLGNSNKTPKLNKYINNYSSVKSDSIMDWALTKPSTAERPRFLPYHAYPT